MMPSEHKLSAHHFDRISAYADVNHAVIGFRSTYEDSAWAFYLHALLNEYALVGLRDTVRHHPRSSATGSGSGRRILAVVKEHAGVNACRGVHRFAGYEIKEFAASRSQVFCPAHRIE